MSHDLLPDLERVLGKDHPNTVTTRHNIAAWTWETGDVGEALRLLQDLLPDLDRVLGKDDPVTEDTRASIQHLETSFGPPWSLVPPKSAE